MKASVILSGATELLSRRKGWTQCAMARAAPDPLHPAGMKVKAQSPLATCWCASGAIEVAGSPLGQPYSEETAAAKNLAREYVARAADLPGPPYIVEWNDNARRTKRQVVAAFRRAREQAIHDGV